MSNPSGGAVLSWCLGIGAATRPRLAKGAGARSHAGNGAPRPEDRLAALRRATAAGNAGALAVGRRGLRAGPPVDAVVRKPEGAVGVLINNAGLQPVQAGRRSIPYEFGVRAQFETNVSARSQLCRLGRCPGMRRRAGAGSSSSQSIGAEKLTIPGGWACTQPARQRGRRRSPMRMRFEVKGFRRRRDSVIEPGAAHLQASGDAAVRGLGAATPSAGRWEP